MSLPAGEAEFAALFERHRRELQVHCYRMLGSLHDAEDLVQETFLRAWRSRERFEGRSSFRTWLYRIATNACLDALGRRKARPVELGGGFGEIPWLQPYPDHLLEEVADTEAGPDSRLVGKETIELAFMAAIQHLPATQRAVLILRDVVGLSAKETPSLLDTSVASANSALQRARETMQARLPARRAEWERKTAVSVEERELLLLLGPKRFTDLRAGLPHVGPDVLAQRLRDLEAAGLLERRTLAPPAGSRVYELTERGRALEPVLVELGRWGTFAPVPPGDPRLGVDSTIIALRTLFDPERAGGLGGTFELRLGGRAFRAEVARGELALERGEAPDADAAIAAGPMTLAALLWQGRKLPDAERAGELSIEGDRRAAKRFLSLFPLPEPG